MEKDQIKTQMKKGILEFCILQIISDAEVYASDILKKLLEADLIVVEGTLYPLLSRLKRDDLVDYKWVESKSGPPRKYYVLTTKGEEKLTLFKSSWEEINNSVNYISHHGKQKNTKNKN
ncbi:PadR family transcriptional regulator [Candidatus Dojkabacteria bacterium]|nr:PadR family transcriptional regulator [Candidatus Dojkabacteria bacterium]